MKLHGDQAISAYTRAANLVKSGKIEEARAIKGELLKSDWNLIQQKIAEREAK